jgi:transcriptional regulator GlxA family with amidase domain
MCPQQADLFAIVMHKTMVESRLCSCSPFLNFVTSTETDMKKIAFIVPPTVQLLYLAGPVQVFSEAKYYGYDLSLEFYSFQAETACSAGLPFGALKDFAEAALSEGDYVIMPGMLFTYIQSISFRAERKFFNWLKACVEKKITVCSICNGAFALGEAGLLDGIECTTHWRRIGELQSRFPRSKVLADVLFVKSGYVYTSAGVSAGIDLSLSILEDLKGPLFTHKVARSLVVYHRRSHNHKQESIYLDYRNHINPQVHQVQDYLIEHMAEENDIESLADMVAMSPRNLSRVFKQKTGTTVLEYLTQLRIEKAKTLLNNPDYTLEYIASQCGFKTARQLQRILKEKKGATLPF